MQKKYQKTEIEMCRPAVPEQVSVALAELAGEVQEGLLALAVGIGLQVMAAMMEADVTAACGPKGRHDPERTATRHGHGAGSVSLGGRRVPVQRPRMRATDGSGELAVASYELFSDTEVLGRDGDGADAGRVVDPALLGGPGAGRVAHRAQRHEHLRSAVSRRFVAATETGRSLPQALMMIIVSESSAEATRRVRTGRSTPARSRSSTACNDTPRHTEAQPSAFTQRCS